MAASDEGISVPSCFVISEIGEAGSPIRIRADKILRHVIAPAAEVAGFAYPDRADAIRRPDMISPQIIQKLVNADVVVADLSGHNPNVFYELALRHAFTKPAILLFDPSTPLPFDVKDLRGIPITTDVQDAIDAKDQLTRMLEEVRENPSAYNETPFTVGIDLAALLIAARIDPEDVAGRVVEDFEELRTEVAALRSMLEERAILPLRDFRLQSPVSAGDVPFQPGQRVSHFTLGTGVVVSCEAVPGDVMVVVAFPGKGVKKMLQSFARLQLVAD
ncbi:MAG: hypothetical protein O2919_04450 [Chloroflexi bacterium]|nr:hypothetical protein [Chloroflexota bacterium]